MASGSYVLDRLDAFAVESIGARGGHGKPSKQWNELARRAAGSSCTILITGETGVGKEHLARWIHAHSSRRDRPFVPVNCGAIPETIIDSQLFGHVRGSFTGATADHIGLVRAAEGGTLFLDEITELPLSAQARLLRLLQDGEAQPVGRSTPMIVDARVIAASNRDVRTAVAASRFREDLFFRLDVVHLLVRPLRERPEELMSLLAEFNSQFAELYRQPELTWDRQAVSMLKRYRWPGNIRQLRSVVERLHVLCPRQRVTSQHLLEIGQLGEPAIGSAPPQSLQQVKSDAIRRVLADTGGSISRTAAAFGVHRSTIYRWLKAGA
ncbi:MAG: sigma-54 interaction domain-containing protein [Planctomycetota bacterium]|jgi:two-component system nitrogen regulation response regulator NtrX